MTETKPTTKDTNSPVSIHSEEDVYKPTAEVKQALNDHISNPEFVKKAAIEGAQDQDDLLAKPTAEVSEEKLAEQLHGWYLEAVQEIDPNNYNHKAQKPYNELNEDQKFLDRYIAEKAIALFHSPTTALKGRVVEEIKGVLITDKDLENATYADGVKVQRKEVKQLIKWVNKRTIEQILKAITNIT